jgi:hypothetical protein
MYGKSSLESNWPEPWSFVGGRWRRGARGAGQAAALVMDRVGSHGFAAVVDTIGYGVFKGGLIQRLLNRWTSQLDLGCTTGCLERVVSVHNST